MHQKRDLCNIFLVFDMQMDEAISADMSSRGLSLSGKFDAQREYLGEQRDAGATHEVKSGEEFGNGDTSEGEGAFAGGVQQERRNQGYCGNTVANRSSTVPPAGCLTKIFARNAIPGLAKLENIAKGYVN